EGLPKTWIAKMRSSMATLTPLFSSNRAVREYCERYYLPAADAFSRRIARGGERAAALVRLRRTLEGHWAGLRVGDVRVHTEGGQHHFAAALYVDDVDPDAITVELYAEASGDLAPARTPMRRGVPLIGARGFTYVAEVPDARPR